MSEFRNPFVNAKVVGHNRDPEEYHDSPAQRGDKAFVMSRSSLMDFIACPHKWLKGYVRRNTEDLEWGTLMDALVVLPLLFDKRFAVTPATYPATPKKKGDPVEMKPWTRRATYCEEWEERQAPKTVVKLGDYERARAAFKALDADEIAHTYLRACARRQVHVTADFKDADTGFVVPVQVLIDLVPDAKHLDFGKTLGDFKTATTAAPGEWEKHVYNFNYDAQAALYLDVYVAATGEDRQNFCHIIQESYEPWEVGRRILSAEFIEIGRLKYLNALRMYCQCLKTGLWHGYDNAPGARTWNGWRFAEPQHWMLQ